MTTITREHRTTRLGANLEGAASVPDALNQAGLDWGLNIRNAENMTIMGEDGITTTSIPGHRLVMRDDTHVTLGVVGGRYQPIDNREVFGLAEHLLAQGATFAEAGELDHGRKVFLRMNLPEQNIALASGKDRIRFGMTIRASHDGSGNVMAGLEGHRMVCTNGMVAKIPNLPHSFKVRHTANAAERMAEAQGIMAGAGQYVSSFLASVQHMLDTPMNLREFTRFIDGLFPKPEEEGRSLTIWENRRTSLRELFRFADTNDVGRGSTWGAYNALTEHLDWVAPVRNGGDVVQTRALRQFEGTNQAVKDQAFAALV